MKFDFAKSELFDYYLPTPSHAGAMAGLLSGLNNNTQQSHIIVGPYGTGKSLIGTLIAGIASHFIRDEDYQTLINKYESVDDSIHKDLKNVKSNNTKFLPVFLNGYEGRFREAVLSGLLKTLNRNKIPITVPGEVSKITSTIDMWEQDFPKTFEAFKHFLEESNKDYELWRLEILSYNRDEIDWFKYIFPSLTAGTEFTNYETQDFVEQLKYVLSKLSNENMGIILIYDEFGRFLQNLNSESINEAMQDLQDIAELSNEESSNLHNVLIAHKNLRQYFSHLSRDFQQEFQRIEKRYSLYHIDNDRSTFLRLGQKILDEASFSQDSSYVSKMKERLRKYPLFQDLNMTEVEQLVIKGFYPLHPVATFILPELSKVYGQNERTLFTFLESNISGGLRKHIINTDEYYLPHQLFDYFFPEMDRGNMGSDYSEDIALFNRLIKKTKLTNEETNIIRLLLILKITNSYSKLNITKEFLSFSMNKDITEQLQSLSDKKVVRFNYVQDHWELYDGSSVDLRNAINQRALDVKMGDDEIESYLLSLMHNKFYLPSEYNHQKSMTRFAKVNFLFEDKLDDVSYVTNNDIDESDILINYVLPKRSSISTLLDKVASDEDEFTFYVIERDLSLDNVSPYLKEWKTCEVLLEEGLLAKEDQTVIEELEFRITELKSLIYTKVEAYDRFSESLTWIHQGKSNDILSRIQLERRLTELMIDKYPQTPEILNDAFNRRKISRVQRKAGIDVIDGILGNPSEENIGITGSGPDYLIYATVFKNNGINIEKLNEITHPTIKAIREKLLLTLAQNEFCTLKQLIDVVQSKPYGVRKPIIPILIVGLLRDKWNNLVLYKNDMFIAGINGEKIFDMIENEPETISVQYYDYNEEYRLLFEYVEDVFADYIHESMDDKPLFLKVTSALLEWLRSLPKYTQLSENMTGELIDFKRNIRYSEIDPNASVQYLKTKWSQDESFLEKYKKSLESFIPLKINEFEAYIYHKLNCSNYAELLRWAKNQDSFQQKKNPLVYAVLNSAEEDLIELLAVEVIGIPLTNWSDITTETFYEQIQRHIQSLYVNTSEGTEIKYNGKVKSVKQVRMSPKTKTLYDNVYRILKNGGRTVSNDEIETLIVQLMEDFIE
ncbi:hypothetical protein LCM20_16725 [Halobacillus litoralis]|uniref:hypothetical protein n=1 Tax=Halobacillus litoralis TaxID=45668 RepID=UPI001CD3A1C6|nr:hypothetical protein [Halobacillus litoralis]MCA0972255.1 hypothetical protein [Halobacillus litoralis]